MDSEEGYYDPFQPRVERGFVFTGNVFWMDTDTAVVTSVMCAGKDVDLQVSERPGLYYNIGSGPWTKSTEPGEGSHVPVLGNIVDNGFKGHSPEPGDSCFRAGPTRAGARGCIGTTGLIIDPGPGESFPGFGSVLARPNFLDAHVPALGRFLPESGGIPDGPGSTGDLGSGSGKPFRVMEGRCQSGSWNAIENEHEELPCESGDRLRQLDFT